jgi:hypothetical protein
MGPPPPNAAPAGRYNEAGRPALYLTDRPEAAALEARGDGHLFVQLFIVPAKELQILDAVPVERPGFVDSVFDAAEECGLDGRSGPSDLSFPRLVARLARQAGYDGMRVPGVRGSIELRYTNLVVFDPMPHWERWATGDAGFRAVGA